MKAPKGKSKLSGILPFRYRVGLRAFYSFSFVFIFGLSLANCRSSGESEFQENDSLLNQPERCTLRPDPGPCRASIPAYFYDHSSKACKEFRYGGCKGVLPFRTLDDCKVSCIR